MIAIDLTDHQAATLRDYLERTLRDLSVEIRGTDRKTYRDEIKEERDELALILRQLEPEN